METKKEKMQEVVFVKKVSPYLLCVAQELKATEVPCAKFFQNWASVLRVLLYFRASTVYDMKSCFHFVPAVSSFVLISSGILRIPGSYYLRNYGRCSFFDLYLGLQLLLFYYH